MNTSENINEIAAALAVAQAQIEHASKDRANDHFKSRYATLAAVDDACRPHLAANGIAIVSAPAFDNATKVATVSTRLIHKSGQWIGCECSTPVAQATAQGIGSAITYLRRYTLSALAGVAPDDDDDGNAASQPAAREQAPRTQRKQASQDNPPAPAQPTGSDPLVALAGVGWTAGDVEECGIGTGRDALRALFAAARDGLKPDQIGKRAAKRIGEAVAAGVYGGVVDQYGKPHTWSHETINKIKASLGGAA